MAGQRRRMSKARLVITAVVVEGRTQGEVARAYGVSQGVDQPAAGPLPGRGRGGVLAAVAAAEDLAAPSIAATIELIVRVRKELSRGRAGRRPGHHRAGIWPTTTASVCRRRRSPAT